MKGRGKDIVIGIIILVIGLGAIYLFRHRKAANPVASPTPTQTSAFEQKLENNFNITIPDNVVKTDLKDVSNSGGQGIVTVEDKNSKKVYTVIADLEDPQPGYFYEAWLVDGSNAVPMGILYQGKGGWMFSFETKDSGSKKTVWVTLEKVNDKTPEKRILEGTLQ